MQILQGNKILPAEQNSGGINRDANSLFESIRTKNDFLIAGILRDNNFRAMFI